MKRRFFKGDIAVISDKENFNLINDIEVEIGDTFNQWNMNFEVVGISDIHVFVKEV